MRDTIKAIKTVKAAAETQYKEKGSVFNGRIFPISDEDEVSSIMNELKKNYYDASHHCYAFRLKDNTFRYSDDGEPSGTAGIRILNAIDHYELTDTLCVVIRYFGGTKLGVGPLGKAYYFTADNVIKSAEIIKKLPFYSHTITAPFEFTSQLFHILDKYNVKIQSRDYESTPRFVCLFPAGFESIIISELIASSKNKIEITPLEGIVYL